MATHQRHLRVLLIEDDDDHVDLIRNKLRRVAGHSIELTRSDRLSAGLRELDAGAFDAVLLDLNLPDSNGPVTCYRVCDSAPDVPVVVMTASKIASDGVQLVREKAEDYLPKSDLNGELILRAILCAIERTGRRVAESGLQHAKGQLDAARQIQTEVLPTTPPAIPGFEIAASSWPAEIVAGDYYDFLPGWNETLGIAVGDACGHGPRAAMLMALAAGSVRTAFDAGDDLGVVLSRVNAVLDHHPPETSLMTLILIRLDPHTRSLVYSSAGHPHGYVFDESGKLQVTLNAHNGVALGVFGKAEYDQSDPLELPVGHQLVMVSDGVLEAHTEASDLFGEQRLFDTVAGQASQTAEGTVQAIHTSLRLHLHGALADDDITVVVVKSID